MNNPKQGSTSRALLIIIALLVIFGGIYIYKNKTRETSVVVDNAMQLTNQSNLSSSQTIANQENTSTLGAQKICSLSGNNIDDSQNQNGLTFRAQGQSCVTMSGFIQGWGSDDKSESITFNGVTKSWKYASLSLEAAQFSLDGKHFAYTASNIPLHYIPLGSDRKLDWLVVSDNVAGPTYDTVYYPQYSQDGKHLGYCATRNDQYLKIIDGVEKVTTKDDYFSTCGSLFGYSVTKKNEGLGAGNDIYSPDRKYEIKTGFHPHPESVNCNMADCPVYLSLITGGTTKEYGPYSLVTSVAFSPDGKHVGWLAGSNGGQDYASIYVDGKRLEQSYDEAFNLDFSKDSLFVTYNARSGTNVYFVRDPIN